MRRPVFLLAPGAGASTAHPRMLAFAEMLRELGAVHTLDYPYMTAGRKRPDPLPRLMEAHREALETARRASGSPVVLVGKSMGGRVGCHVALTEPTPAVICLGYPLCGGGDRAKLRDQVLRDLTTPTLFIQGTRDALCPLDLLNTVRADMRAQNELHVVSGGDHSLMVSKTELKRTGTTQADADHAIQIAIREFIGKTLK